MSGSDRPLIVDTAISRQRDTFQEQQAGYKAVPRQRQGRIPFPTFISSLARAHHCPSTCLSSSTLVYISGSYFCYHVILRESGKNHGTRRRMVLGLSTAVQVKLNMRSSSTKVEWLEWLDSCWLRSVPFEAAPLFRSCGSFVVEALSPHAPRFEWTKRVNWVYPSDKVQVFM